MKLNRLQRYTAYCILLQQVDRDYHHYAGFCYWTTHIFINEEEKDLYDWKLFSKTFPELYNKGIKDGEGNFYFEDWKTRIKALEECIKETY